MKVRTTPMSEPTMLEPEPMTEAAINEVGDDRDFIRAGDRVLASDEAVAAAGSEAAERRSAQAAAARLAQLDFAPARPEGR